MRSIYDNAVLLGFTVSFATQTAVVTIGPVVDTKGYNTAALRVFTSSLPGNTAPSATQLSSLAVVLQESVDAVTWTTAIDNTGAAIGFTQVATNVAVIQSARIEGLGLSNNARYFRIQTTSLLAGTIATQNQFTACAVLELARAYNNPVTSVVSNT